MNSNTTTIVINKNQERKCKLIGTGLMRKYEDHIDVKTIFEIPNAIITSGFNLENKDQEVLVNDIVFRIEPYNENGDLFKMHIMK